MYEITDKDLKYIKKICAQFKSNKIKDSLLNEIEGEAIIGLVKACDSWDKTKPKSIDSWIYTCVCNSIISYLRKIKKFNNECNCDIDELFTDSCLNTEEIMINKELLIELNKLIKLISKGLTKRERFILKNNILSDKPKTLRQISDKFNCGKSTIYRDRKKLMYLIKKEGQRLI